MLEIKELLARLVDSREMLDLKAQLDMAFWAEWMFWATIGSLVLSAGAVVAALLSLRASRKAAREARQVGEYQTQAYVHASKAEFGRRTNILLHCKNSGLTPATRFSVNAIATMVAPGKVSGSIGFPGNGYKTWSALGAGETLSVSILDQDATLEDFLRSGSGSGSDERLLIAGQIIYSTIFGHTHVTQFAFYVEPSSKLRFRRPTATLTAFERQPSSFAGAILPTVPVLMDDHDSGENEDAQEGRT